MFFVNFRLHKKVIILCLLTITAVLLAIAVIHLEKIGNSVSVAESKITDELTIEEYITSFGPKIDVKQCKVDTITVPYEFSEVYSSYNELQKSQGFDLERYKGIELTRYTYPVLNYPDNGKSVFVEVLTLDGRVVAADIYSTDSDGFMMPLK